MLTGCYYERIASRRRIVLLRGDISTVETTCVREQRSWRRESYMNDSFSKHTAQNPTQADSVFSADDQETEKEKTHTQLQPIVVWASHQEEIAKAIAMDHTWNLISAFCSSLISKCLSRRRAEVFVAAVSRHQQTKLANGWLPGSLQKSLSIRKPSRAGVTYARLSIRQNGCKEEIGIGTPAFAKIQKI